MALTAEAFLHHFQVDSVTLVGQPGEMDALRSALGDRGAAKRPRFCPGGRTRQESVALGLRYLLENGAGAGDLVLVHDAARPLVSGRLISRCIETALEQGAAIAAYPVAETMKRVSVDTARVEATVDRDNLWAAQTPQAAFLGELLQASDAAASLGLLATDESSLLELTGHPPVIVPGERANIKITTQDDLAYAETLLAGRAERGRKQAVIRVGIGYDIHQLVPGRRLVLGGVEIPHSRGLLGHSDADVLLHAVCDALLGAAALPDIGHLFPNDDPAFAGADSVGLLRAVRSAVWDAGYAVNNVDACVIAEQPKISPHAPEMKRIIAEALQVSENDVSIKATTNENIGSLGAEEGIACHATALIIRIR